MLIEIVENVRIHDFRFECKIEVCTESKSHLILGIDTYFIGIDDFGVRLSESGSNYVCDAYYIELEDAINYIVGELYGG